MNYCSVDDVLSIATIFRKDVYPESGSDAANFRQNTNTIPIADVEYIIEEASEMVRSALQPRYSSTVIDALSPDFPPVVVYWTKAFSAILMYRRYASQSIERNNELIKVLEKEIETYQQIVVGGNLRDADGNLVTTQVDPELLAGVDNTEFTADGLLQELYEDGRVY